MPLRQPLTIKKGSQSETGLAFFHAPVSPPLFHKKPEDSQRKYCKLVFFIIFVVRGAAAKGNVLIHDWVGRGV